MVKKLIGVVLALTMVVTLLAACTGPQGPAGLPGNPGQPGLQGPPGEPMRAVIEVIPASAHESDVITIMGSGFDPDEEIEAAILAYEFPPILLGYRQDDPSGEGKLKVITADDAGNVFIASSVPRDNVLPEGVYTIRVVGVSSGKEAFAPLLKGDPGVPPVQHQH